MSGWCGARIDLKQMGLPAGLIDNEIKSVNSGGFDPADHSLDGLQYLGIFMHLNNGSGSNATSRLQDTEDDAGEQSPLPAGTSTSDFLTGNEALGINNWPTPLERCHQVRGIAVHESPFQGAGKINGRANCRKGRPGFCGGGNNPHSI